MICNKCGDKMTLLFQFYSCDFCEGGVKRRGEVTEEDDGYVYSWGPPGHYALTGYARLFGRYSLVKEYVTQYGHGEVPYRASRKLTSSELTKLRNEPPRKEKYVFNYISREDLEGPLEFSDKY